MFERQEAPEVLRSLQVNKISVNIEETTWTRPSDRGPWLHSWRFLRSHFHSFSAVCLSSVTFSSLYCFSLLLPMSRLFPFEWFFFQDFIFSLLLLLTSRPHNNCFLHYIAPFSKPQASRQNRKRGRRRKKRRLPSHQQLSKWSSLFVTFTLPGRILAVPQVDQVPHDLTFTHIWITCKLGGAHHPLPYVSLICQSLWPRVWRERRIGFPGTKNEVSSWYIGRRRWLDILLFLPPFLTFFFFSF